MNEEIRKYFEMKLLWKNHRVIDETGKIKDIYVQPERLNPKDAKIYIGTLPDCLNLCDPTSVCDSPTTENK